MTAGPAARRPVAAVEWAQAALPGCVPTWFRTRPWAEVWSVAAPADDRTGRWWLKVTPVATGYEPRLLQVLADVGTSLSPKVRVHPRQPWALVADAGRPVWEASAQATDPVAVVDFWCVLLARYAELQQVVPAEVLRAAGVPDASAVALPGLLAELLAEPDWLVPTYAPDLTEDDRNLVRGCEAALRDAAAALADGLPATLQHDDLHDGNVFVPTLALDPARALVIDWGDASISHPFGTLLVTLGVLARSYGLAPDGAEVARLRSAYLEVWRTRGESALELDRQLDLALRTGPLVRAAGWRRALGTPQAGVELGMAGATGHWLRRLAHALAVG